MFYQCEGKTIFLGNCNFSGHQHPRALLNRSSNESENILPRLLEMRAILRYVTQRYGMEEVVILRVNLIFFVQSEL